MLIILIAITGITSIILLQKTNACGGYFTAGYINRQIQHIDTYREIKAVFDACDENTLVTFDIDDTLITAHDVFVRTPDTPLWFKLCLAAKYFTTFWNTAKKEQAINDFLGVFLQQVPRFVFDHDIVQFIKQLHQQKCTVIGLTTIGSGSAGSIKSLPEWRATMLDEFGINFSTTCNDASFKTLPMRHQNYPCLYKGILCANYISKGFVLGAFLDCYHIKPKLIISFDDQQSALRAIAQECNQRKIPFTGYQILGAKKLPGEWNTNRALLQFDYALQHKRWLCDKEADAMLAQNTRMLNT